MATINDILVSMNESGVFAYVIPFLLIFVVVFAILEKSGILKPASGESNKAISAVIAASLGLLALQYGNVSIWYATIFPHFGVGLSILLVVLILFGFLGFQFSMKGEGKDLWKSPMFWIGLVVAGAVVIWSVANRTTWFDGAGGYTIQTWLGEYFWAVFWIAAIIGLIIWVSRSSGPPKKPETPTTL